MFLCSNFKDFNTLISFPGFSASLGVITPASGIPLIWIKCQVMSKDQKAVWLVTGIIVLVLLLNVSLLKTTYTGNQNLFWMLIVSIPLLIIAIYIAWQTNHLLRKHFVDGRKPSTPHNHFEWLSHSIYSNKIDETDLRVLVGNDQCSKRY